MGYASTKSLAKLASFIMGSLKSQSMKTAAVEAVDNEGCTKEGREYLTQTIDPRQEVISSPRVDSERGC